VTALDILWDDVKDRVFCTREEFDSVLAAWDVVPVVRGGDTVAAVVMRDGEIHCAVRPGHRGRWLTRGMRWMLEKSNRCSTDKRNAQARRFIERLGFKLVREDDYDAHYAI
jgi:GNAT superfamily N-acetyltransferase